MTRSKFVSQYLTPSAASTVATRRATEQDKRDARRDRGVDFHVNQATDKE
jgi:hypothetical protein